MEKNYLGHDIGKLGFGLMRMPMDGAAVDMEHTNRMVDAFMQAGFTYYDTAYVYLGGNSERLVKPAIVERYPRESFQLATKMPLWNVKEYADLERIFDEQLERMGTDYIDFYLLHSLGKIAAETADEVGAWRWGAEMKKRGKIKHFGFSFHDSAEVLDGILTAHPEVEFVQLQINYADWEDSQIQSRLCYEVAMKHSKPVIIMEPVKGGGLANLHDAVQEVFTAANPNMSVASWAMRYCASLDGIITILSGMSNIEQMEDNISYMKQPVPLTDAERSVIDDALKALNAVPQISCTDCKYCVEDCPQKIKIPNIFGVYNNYLRYRTEGPFMWRYRDTVLGSGKASDCIACGACEGHCPQHINIIEHLKEIGAFAD